MDNERKKVINDCIDALTLELDTDGPICGGVKAKLEDLFEAALGVSLKPDKPKKEGFAFWDEINPDESETKNILSCINNSEGSVDFFACDDDVNPISNGKILRINADGTISCFTGVNPNYGLTLHKNTSGVVIRMETLTQDQ